MSRRPRKDKIVLSASIFAGPGSRDMLKLAQRGHSHNQPGKSKRAYDKGRFVMPDRRPKRWSTI
jgi:hypothetical protein